MRIVTWNIHKGIGGVDRRYDLDRVVAELARHEPDLVLLQEVDEGVPRSRHHAQARLIAEGLGLPHVAFEPNVRLSKGCYGNATLSRNVFLERSNLDLTLKPKKARGALYTRLRVRLGARRVLLNVLNVHLGLAGVERRWQVRRLLGHRRLSHLPVDSAIVIAGDTNDWAGALPRGRLMQAGFRCVTGTGARALRTFPSWKPVGALDKVFVRGPVDVDRCALPRTQLARAASDHLPIVLDLNSTPR